MNEVTDDTESTSKERLKTLSNFQSLMLKHALSFPNLKKLVYSTCSIHPEENEEVVQEIFSLVKDKFKLKKVMPDWPVRGQEGHAHAHRYLRMSPDTTLTNGFFVACFKRRKQGKVKLDRQDGNEDDVCENIGMSIESDGEIDLDESHEQQRESEEDRKIKGDDMSIDKVCGNEKSSQNKKKKKKKKERSDCIDNADVQSKDECCSKFAEDSPKMRKKKRKRMPENADCSDNGNKNSDNGSEHLYIKRKKKFSEATDNVHCENDNIQSQRGVEATQKKKRN